LTVWSRRPVRFIRAAPSFEKLGRSWGISGSAVIVDQVFSAVANWRREFTACGVSLKDIERFAEIDDYLRR
jgi:hypothetical protein